MTGLEINFLSRFTLLNYLSILLHISFGRPRNRLQHIAPPLRHIHRLNQVCFLRYFTRLGGVHNNGIVGSYGQLRLVMILMIKIPAKISRCSLLENTSISPKELVHANSPMLVGLASEKFIPA